VGGGHRLYYEECGAEDGLPALYLHGGPGSACGALHRRFFAPDRFRAVLYDQRGAGRSQPWGQLQENHTEALVQDLERLREHLQIERWLLCAGSWGATLALVYAQRYPGRVSAMVLRGTFLARRQDLQWYFGPDGAARLYPEAYAELREQAADPDILSGLHRATLGPDPRRQLQAALALDAWDSVLVSHTLPAESTGSTRNPEEIRRRASILLHYAAQGFFLGPGAALAAPQRLVGIPGEIIHGRQDLVCPVENAWTLHRCWPGSRLTVLPRSGHVLTEPELSAAVVLALESLADRLA
jgi:proline iminopeptidase